MDNEKNIEFIKNDLLPEAVHDRCFCETGSREFVEFVSVDVESSRSFEKIQQRATKYYRARLIVNFSNEPKIFALMIKLLNHANNDEQEKRDYDEFLNEEMFYGKMTKKYKLNVYPRCYVADMGRYDGRPVIVLEDLEASGYVRVNDKLDEDHLVLALRAIEGLHERGFRLKAQNFNSFREFYAKLNDTRLDAQSTNVFTEASNRISRILRKLRYGASEKVELEKDENLFTMCHGNLIPHECFFFKYENKKPVDVRIIGWNRMRYCSIVHDLAYILHDRIFNEDEVEKYLRVYIKAADK